MPIYETDADRAAELHVLKLVAAHLGYEVIRTPPLTPVDAYFVDHGRIQAVAEVKRRVAYRSDAFDTYMIDVRKIVDAYLFVIATGVPLCLIYEWSDAIAYTVIPISMLGTSTLGKWSIAVGGRTDRHDPLDLDPVFQIPSGLFARIAKEPL